MSEQTPALYTVQFLHFTILFSSFSLVYLLPSIWLLLKKRFNIVFIIKTGQPSFKLNNCFNNKQPDGNGDIQYISVHRAIDSERYRKTRNRTN